METGYKRKITEQQVNEMDDFVYKHCEPPMRLGFKIQKKTGMRISDVVRFNINTIDWQLKCAKIIQYKTNEPLTIYFDDETWEYLKSYCYIFKREIEECEGFILFSYDNDTHHLSEGSFRAKWQQFRKAYHYDIPYYIKRNGMPMYDLSNHVMRRRMINRVMDMTHDIRIAKAMAGHKKYESTLKYLNDPSEESVKAIVPYI